MRQGATHKVLIPGSHAMQQEQFMKAHTAAEMISEDVVASCYVS